MNVRLRRAALLILAFAALSGASTAGAASGDLDPRFGRDGKLAPPQLARGRPGDIAVLPSGASLVCVTGAQRGREGITVVRLRPDGSLARGFGREGLARLRAPARATGCRVEALGREGAIVSYGIRDYGSSSSFELGVARLTRDGRLDGRFDRDGIQTFGVDDGTFAGGLAMSQDGIYVGGYTQRQREFVVYRLNLRGQIDSGFAGDGRAETSFDELSARAWGLASLELDSAGRIVLAGTVSIDRGSFTKHAFGLARLTADGRLDESFSDDGMIADWDRPEINAAAVAPDGRIAIASGLGDFTVSVVRPDGTLDPEFGAAGTARVDFTDANDIPADIAWDGNAILASGSTRTQRRGEDFAIARLRPDGELDGRFSGDGKRAIDFGRADDNVTAMAIGPLGRVTLAGETDREPGQVDRPVFARIRG
ncbi:hypothetical protein HJD18_00525 [Thermoleophilia bacterium SCSIO 60948]|nr:hypothetical protein HJD18_00525 [Thermoleophilia bacterium SCSIO 60948]